jgi:hypothetical protein
LPDYLFIPCLNVAFQNFDFIDRHFGTDLTVFFIVEEIRVFTVVFPFPAITFEIDSLGWSPFSTIILVGIGNIGLVRRGLVLLDHVHLSIGVWVSVIAYTDGVDWEMLLVERGSSLLLCLVGGSYL